MDYARACARWSRRRLAVLGPALGGCGLLAVYLHRGADLRPSARLALLAVVALVAAFCLTVLGLTLLCRRLHRRGRIPEARLLRRLLEPAERLVAPAVLLLLPTALAPPVFRRPAPPPPVFARAPLPAPPCRPAILDVPAPVAPGADLPEPAGEAPTDAPPSPAPLVAPAPAGGDGRDDNEGFGLRYEDVELPELKPEFVRLGVPEDRRPLQGRPIAARLDAWVAWEDDDPAGAGFAMSLDVPVEDGPMLSISTLYAGLSDEPELAESAPEFALTHAAIEAVFRLAGGTRTATLDVRLRLGLAVDAVEVDGLSSSARVSPHLALDVAIWQSSRAGFVLHAGQTIPVNLTGGSAAVTEISAEVRIDLSERISFRAGWRYVLVHARDYGEPAETHGVLAEVDREISGPFAGIEVRF